MLIGAATTLVDHRRRLPRLQRQQRPAVRADLRAQGQRPQRGEPREGQRGARRRHARRRSSTRSRRCAHNDGTVTAQLGLKLETTVKPLPMDSTILVRPRSALGLKYVEITKGTSKQGFDGRRDGPARAARSPSRSRSTRSSARSTTRRGGLAGEPARVRRRARRPRRWTSTARSTAFNPLLRNLGPVMTQPRRPAHAARRGCSRRSSGPPPQVAPVAETQAALFAQPRHARSRRSRASRGRLPAVDRRAARRRWRPRSGRFPPQRPFLANSERAVPRAAPGRPRRCAPPAPTSPTRSSSARARCAARRRSTSSSSRRSRRCSASPRTRWSRSASTT